ncbi:two component transcriptional regulator, LuxR family [Beutenbergia cavernae DSM 12333]|uniref:Two component transcriptional regulator, LuxR family n=1 Tax=Beutenbergia cavernae (strain ATCC BAA-8 / DSM 12333 / CCUG 43141 / JCM 11478 / NBRC 16432 / NCIMB 13614 / HKI 0122) TaxID=471853 RepID=C5BYM0_BEUC1|nr:response regulator transcription factor [Beutenbergia cavernae]ACQ78978.1 two component transcriptional regulator, LuxR family [Beutenbergia cavernae DSM 12333]
MSIRIVVVDDHPVVRDGIRGQLATTDDLDVVGEAASADEALAVVAATSPDLVVTDLRMPGGGVSLITHLAASAPGVAVLVLTTYDTPDDVLPALDAGARGYVLKDAPREELFRAVRAVADGETFLAPSVAGLLVSRVRARQQPAPAALSGREVDVLRLVADGRTNRQAAQLLGVTEATVKTHLLHVYAKLGVPDRAAAVAAGYRSGLLP